jgi:hypothetical protein
MIILYMVINIITAHLGLVFTYMWIGIKRCCDSCCGRLTRKRMRKEFLELYIGPEFAMGIRYSQILTTIFVILLYSPGIPILYVLCFIFFFITYWLDKILVLRVYRTPPQINLYMTKLFIILLFLGVILHLGFSIWMYGNKYIMPYSDKTFLDQISNIVGEYLNQYANDNFKAEVIRKITLPHNLILFIFLCFLVAIYILKKILYDPLHLLYKICIKNFTVPDDKLNIYDGI